MLRFGRGPSYEPALRLCDTSDKWDSGRFKGCQRILHRAVGPALRPRASGQLYRRQSRSHFQRPEPAFFSIGPDSPFRSLLNHRLAGQLFFSSSVQGLATASLASSPGIRNTLPDRAAYPAPVAASPAPRGVAGGVHHGQIGDQRGQLRPEMASALLAATLACVAFPAVRIDRSGTGTP